MSLELRSTAGNLSGSKGQSAKAEKNSVVVVDFNDKHRQQLSDVLLPFYAISGYSDGVQALEALSIAPPDLVIVGGQVGQASGIGFIKSIRQVSALNQVPVLYIADRQHSEGLAADRAAGANDNLVKPYRRSELIKIISGHLNAGIEREWESFPLLERTALKASVEVFNDISDVIASGQPLPFGAISDACQPLLDAVNKNEFKNILNGVKDHDNYSYAHSVRVATLLSLFGAAAGVKGDDQLMLATGGLLHDIGKMAIPPEVLNKPGRLDETEFIVIKSHVSQAVTVLNASPGIPKPVITIAEQHHEKLNGQGYPHGLKGAELNDLARMTAIVDVFSALTDRRVYKPSMPSEKAFTIMTGEMSHHLDQNFLKLFRSMLLDAVA